jgi:MFS family permease
MGIKFHIRNLGISKFMLLSLFIDEWNIFSIPMLSIFMEHSLHFGTEYLGLVTGATVGGASIGSLLGGYLTDRFGRKKIFLLNILLFSISALLSALSTNFVMLAGFRFMAGLPAGADISNIYSYIMEIEKPGRREIIGAYNTLMASMAILGLNIWVVLLLLGGYSGTAIWKTALLLPLAPATILVLLYGKIPESGIWKNRGARTLYSHFFRDLRNNKIGWRTSIYSWTCGIASGIEVGTFAFFIPYIILKFGISGMVQDRLIIIAIYLIGIPAGYIGPRFIPRIGLRKLSYTGFSLSFLGLVMSGIAIILHLYIVLPISMMTFVWGNHWNNQPIMTSQAMTANPEYRGKAIGLSNFFYQFPSFLSITIFPLMFIIIGIGYSTIVVAMAPLFGIMITLTVFREIFGYRGDLPPEDRVLDS